MSLTEVTLEGTLSADGTLYLDQKPELPAGRVRVVLQSLQLAQPGEDWWHYMQRTRAELEQRNHAMMSDEEVQSYVESLRADDDRIDAIHRQIEEARRRQEPPG